jgi:plasmid stability protein
MCSTCKYAQRMTVMLQVRNVPDQVHRTLKARAAQAGLSLSDYVLAELRRVAERPTREELIARLARRQPVRLKQSAAQALRRERDSR